MERPMISPSMRLLCSSTFAFALAACHSSDATDPGGTTLPPGLTLKLTPFVTTGLSSPVFLTQPLNDGRIFVVEQAGRIRVIQGGVVRATPFLDISSRVLFSGEEGLLSVAFHPQYATNHFFYIYFTTQTNGDIRIERFTATSVDVADPATSKLILTVSHSQQPNHNGGLLTFGPDGMLYAGLGDGGGGGDPFLNGQNFNALLGSLLRFDVNVDPGPYLIPPDNPFVNQANRRGEIWAKGLRNPWRYAFDEPTGLLYIADVGQNLHEEVDVQPASAGGLNYGWNVMEGLSCYNASTCTQTNLTLPVIDYAHTNGACSITGGYVYRGSAIPGIRGHYFYSDYCAGFLRSFRYSGGAAVDQKDWALTMSAVASFGVDAAGELYVMSGNSILKIAQGS
jgi:glucose/arabinose dehydrogenase